MMITANPRPFSVLMSLYARESPAALEVALASLTQQTLQPDETVIVLDGPVRKDHLDILQRYESALAMKIVPLDKNVGLARALAAGLEQCRHEWIARFDTDDWSHPERFARQHAFLDAHPTVGLLRILDRRVRSKPYTHYTSAQRAADTRSDCSLRTSA
ncbi:glycosyltransferase [Ralstonia sp. GP71]|uniref:glycosyltransferase n=1 Tax=Ralstonia sp. GP71 TaxID=3035152 RepID=UPI0038912886